MNRLSGKGRPQGLPSPRVVVARDSLLYWQQTPSSPGSPGCTQAIEHLLRTHPETVQLEAARRKALKASCRNIQWISLAGQWLYLEALSLGDLPAQRLGRHWRSPTRTDQKGPTFLSCSEG